MSDSKSSLPTNRRAHLIGICGSGMRSLATVLAQQGWLLSGSDASPRATQQPAALGVRVLKGHSADHVTSNSQLVIYSDAVPIENPERHRAAELGIPTRSYAQMLGELSASRSTIAIAGTHGKSTVTAMVAEILIQAGCDPTVVCGATPLCRDGGGLVGSGGRHGQGDIAVIEACEYRENFLYLKPQTAAILNIEPDHFDFFRSKRHLLSSFARFAQGVADDGVLLVANECPRTREVIRQVGRRVATFGLARNAQWRAANLQHSRGRYHFDLVRRGRRLTHIALTVPGRHNVRNALAAAALARHSGASIQQIAQGLALFRGLKRRLQRRGPWGAATWIDDYAHHPSEIASSIATVRQMFPRRRLWCVFQPHQGSRLSALLDEMAASLHNVDKIAVADVFRAREGRPQPGEATSADLAELVKADGGDVVDEHGATAIAQRLIEELQPNDVLLTMGAGDLGKIFNEFHRRFRDVRAVA
jgi:UDP-N-acetylmuramate--alanine ligase